MLYILKEKIGKVIKKLINTWCILTWRINMVSFFFNSRKINLLIYSDLIQK